MSDPKAYSAKWKRSASLRSRLALLAVFVALLLAAAAVGFVILMRSTEGALLSDSKQELAIVAQTLAHDYEGRASYEAQQHHPLTLALPQNAGSDDLLSMMTMVALKHKDGVEGGFYSSADDDLLGYAFPTHEGPGIKKDIPGKERPAILDLARKAAISGAGQSLTFSGARDAVLFQASPIVVEGKGIGSVWLMKRMPGLNSGRTRRTLGGIVFFALSALICVLLAFAIASDLRSDVQILRDRLLLLRDDLRATGDSRPRLTELRHVLNEIDVLALALQNKIASERELQDKLRQQEKLASLGQVAAGVAHELRNPLATIRLRAQMWERSASVDARQRSQNVILDEVERLDKIVERLLSFARPIHLDLTQLDLPALCRNALYEIEGRLQDGNVAVDIESDREPLYIEADSTRLRQVIANILSNAIESIEEQSNGAVTVRISQNEETATLITTDNGPGIPPHVLHRVIDPFFTTKERGTGLGLSISYEIIHAHHGTITITNREEGGAQVVVVLPLSQAAWRGSVSIVETQVEG